jgi:hypothetical protein
MKTYEEVYEMLELSEDDGMNAVFKHWLDIYGKYWEARAKLAQITRSFEFNRKHNLPYNEYVIKRQEVEVGYYKRSLEMIKL